MPARISRPAVAYAGASSSSKPQAPAKKRSRKRALDAFAIASHEVHDGAKVRRSRLGQAEEDPRDRKRRRIQQDEHDGESGIGDDAADSEDDVERISQLRRRKQRRTDVPASDEGSDSEGNTWTVGHVDNEDDSEIDSDEAFSEGDEVRFAHLAFSGSKRNQERRRSARRQQRGNADADDLDENMNGGDSEDESLGEDAIDLAQMLDNYSEEEAEEGAKDITRANGAGWNSSEESGGEDSGPAPEEDAYSDSSLEDENDPDPRKLDRLQNLVSSLHPRSAEERHRGLSSYESMVPSATGIVNREKFDIRAILEAAGDAQLTKSSKAVGVIPLKTNKKDLKLAPALPKLQQEKLDRIAANEKAKETLERWTDSVKQVRRAEHLSFPLQDPDAKSAHETGHLLPTINGQPVNDLEATIKSILQESGLAAQRSKVDDFDTLPDNNKASVAEVMAKRAELRRARDLIFREEQRSKRIKKIKSKSYRRVHRKEREKLAALDKDAFVEDFGEMDEEEREAHDRRRAQERMGAKHRDSKWAKQMKKSGRSIWDDDAKSGVSDMARRNEELRRRIAGKQSAGDDGDESSSSSEEDGPSDEDEPSFQLRQLRNKLAKLNEDDAVNEGGGLAAMKFMQRAEANRKAQNKDDIQQMLQEIDGNGSEDNSSSPEIEDVGRRIFGPSSKKSAPTPIRKERQEFEELEDSAAEGDDLDAEIETMPLIDPSVASAQVISTASKSQSEQSRSRAMTGAMVVMPQERDGGRSKAAASKVPDVEISKGERHSAPDTEGWITVTYNQESEESAVSDAESELSQAEILRKAFAGDDVEADFEQEKKATVAEEDEKVIDKTLPGWGSWVGEGISKREQKRNKGKVLVKQIGIRPEDRKDARLKNVIINQKRLKKNLSYMANALPFPFTSQAEYDRSIRMPIGKEWNVSRTFGENTKPRVIVKPGQVIQPMAKPLI